MLTLIYEFPGITPYLKSRLNDELIWLSVGGF